MSEETLRVLVVDDEAPARANIVALLDSDPRFEIVGQARNGRDAVEQIRELAPDLVLLDVQMPGLDGFGVIEEVGTEQMPCTIFVTAHDDFAVRAFEASATDYLVKPFSEERLRAALTRARETLRGTPDSDALARLLKRLSAAPEQQAHLSRLAVRAGDATQLVPVAEIDWIESDDYYAKVHVGAAVHMLRTSLAALEEQLNPEQFVRIHRSTIVNLDRVQELAPWSRGSYAVVLRDGTQLTLSRRRRAHLEAVLGQSL